VPCLALIGPSYPFRGGIARTTTALAAGIGARGALGAFLTPLRQYPRWLYPGGADIDPRACPRLESAVRCFGVFEPWTWPALRRLAAAAAPDAVVVPYWTWAWAPLVRAVTSWGRPVISVVTTPPTTTPGGSSDARPRGARALQRFLLPCGSVSALGRSYAGVGPRCTAAARPAELPARAVARRRLGVPDDATAFLAFGLLRPYKGTDVLLEAFARLPAERRGVLLLAGEPWGGVAADLERRLADPGLAGRVITALRWIPE
jgi:glycosyltransferase involved in cell wall biosynthesis